jgi:serine/threonine protein kinase
MIQSLTAQFEVVLHRPLRRGRWRAGYGIRRRRTFGGALPEENALPIIQQLIDALEYAEEKGIIHRDIKPANTKITPEGRVKVLDFGLAKAITGDATAAGDPASSPTLTMQATMAGVIMGTAAYMAPEQARGQNVDKRADIWAFGIVVYQLLTGPSYLMRQLSRIRWPACSATRDSERAALRRIIGSK